MWMLEEPNSDPPQEQYMVLTVELFLQPQLPSHLIFSLKLCKFLSSYLILQFCNFSLVIGGIVVVFIICLCLMYFGSIQGPQTLVGTQTLAQLTS